MGGIILHLVAILKFQQEGNAVVQMNRTNSALRVQIAMLTGSAVRSAVIILMLKGVQVLKGNAVRSAVIILRLKGVQVLKGNAVRSAVIILRLKGVQVLTGNAVMP